MGSAATACDAQCRYDMLTQYRFNFGIETLVDTRNSGSSVALAPLTEAASIAQGIGKALPLVKAPLLAAGEAGAAGLSALRAIQALSALNSSAVFLVGGGGMDDSDSTGSSAYLTEDELASMPSLLTQALQDASVGVDHGGDGGKSVLAAALSSPLAVLATILAPRDTTWSTNPLLMGKSVIVMEPGSAFPLEDGGGGGKNSVSLKSLRKAVCAWGGVGWSIDVWRGMVHIYPPLRAYTIPPMRIPSALWDEYTMGGKIPVGLEHYNEAVEPGGAPRHVVYTNAKIKDWSGKAHRREVNYYGTLDTDIYALLSRHPEAIQGKRVAILGSLEPWYEVVALEFGAASVFSVEYSPRSSEDPRLQFITPSQMMAEVAAGTWEPFDIAFSVSSFEHDGLGRYGDPLSGDGDLRAMRETREHVLKPGGYLLFAVPVGGDCVVFNAHRVYGRTRLPRMFEGWTQIDNEGHRPEHSFDLWPCAGWNQPPFLLQRPFAAAAVA